MTYESRISFTLDTICPWTYLALKRLQKSLDAYQASNPDSNVTFHLHFLPFQLYPEISREGEDKQAWYKRSRYGDSNEKMRMYETIMKSYGRACGIDFSFAGTFANTQQAHRVVYVVQEQWKDGDEALRVVEALYRMYFEEGKHPSSAETLLAALEEAGIGRDEARQIVEDEDEGLAETKALIREAISDGIDAVPYVVIEGKRRDFSMAGTKEVEEYAKALRQVAQEST